MKKKKIVLLIVCMFILCAFLVFFYFYFTNPNRLISSEKRFLADQSSTVQNINVLNNVSVFGENGNGVFYDFLEDFSHKYGLKTNNVTFNLGEKVDGITLSGANTLLENEFTFYKSHYVLLGIKNEYISTPSHLKKQRTGILTSNLSYIQDSLDDDYLSLQTYSTDEELLKAFKEQSAIQYILVPMHLYLNEILSNDYYVVCHFEDIPYYFKINMGANTPLGTILKKYFASWEEEQFSIAYNQHLFNLFIKNLNISLSDIENMRSVVYQYGFVDNRPYEILSGGNYGGIIAQYLKEFMEFSDVEIKFTKYKNLNKFNTALGQDKIDLYFSYYDIVNSFNTVHSNIGLSFQIFAEKKSDLVVHSLKSLNNKTVYVLENSYLYTYLKNNSKANLKTYKTIKELERVVKNKEIVAIDSQTYSAYYPVLGKYNVRYVDTVDVDYVFKISTDDVFLKLFTKFVNFKNPNESIYKGLYNYDLTLRTGTITGTIARYFMYILIAIVLIFLYVYKLTKKVKISKKIKKEDKLKYIDQLTSLKNRNYLSENLEGWSQNTVYPQAVVVIDLNNLQYINDTKGYEQGDEQIKATANVLVKTQLDKSDIIRTDGNEFVIYLIGYQTKQVTSYIHKLNKEFKKLPYEYGAAIGYSMILDKLKTVEDAINEAVEEVKKQKENKKEVSE